MLDAFLIVLIVTAITCAFFLGGAIFAGSAHISMWLFMYGTFDCDGEGGNNWMRLLGFVWLVTTFFVLIYACSIL